MAVDPLATNIQRSCEFIINNVRMSGLNFSLQETPFSVYFTIRKSLSKVTKIPFHMDSRYQPVNPDTSAADLDTLRLKLQNSDEVIDTLKKKYNDKVKEHEITCENLSNLHTHNEYLHDHIDHIVTEKVKAINEEKRSLQIKHEQICSNFKALKIENSDLVKEVNQLKVALKSSAKEFKDDAHKNAKKVDALETKVKDLSEYKRAKAAEERELKVKVKKVNKKLKDIKEKEAAFKIEKSCDIKKRDIENNNKEADSPTKSNGTVCIHSPQCSTSPTSMVTHLTIPTNNYFQSSGSFTSMVSHFVKPHSPIRTGLSREDALDKLDRKFKDFIKEHFGYKKTA